MSTAVLEPPVRGMGLDEAISEFKRIQDRYAELAEEKRRVMEILVPAATEAKGETKTARLANYDGSLVLKAEFGSSITCDTDTLNTVRDLIGDDKFEELFKTEYSPKQRTLKPFLATKTTDERIETAKKEIMAAIKVSPTPPRISVEKS